MGHNVNFVRVDGSLSQQEVLAGVFQIARFMQMDCDFGDGDCCDNNIPLPEIRENLIFDSFDDAIAGLQELQRNEHRSYQNMAVRYRNEDGKLDWCVQIELRC